MKKLTKAQEKLLQQVKEYLLTLDDEEKDEWYGTPRDVEGYALISFLASIGIHVETEDLS